MGMLAAVRLAATLTGLPERAILTHWIAETGGNWPESNNPANILYFGDPAQFRHMTESWYQNATVGVQLPSGAYLVHYNTQEDGVRAYADLLGSRAFEFIKLTRKVAWLPVHPAGGDMSSEEMAALLALGLSPWDGAHYEPETGSMGPGTSLFQDFSHTVSLLMHLTTLEHEQNSNPPTPPVTSDGSDAEGTGDVDTTPAKTYTVEPGDSLWTIAVKLYGNGEMFREIAKANGMQFPFLIHSGDILTLPI